ncbi:helix-turn-helix domain-containing protein [Bifidobacterium longum]|uniref:helix-turn-helix domain-containing protein n=1 Tax=Bifidobacterium longum TaxID=216816 RepID=UPI00117FD63E|nr:helix-turn-helix transcriptional regulator [Bifidobacterium longum]
MATEIVPRRRTMSLHSDLNQSAQQTGRYQKQLESTITFNVKMLLTAYGYSQSSLAEAMGIGRSAMSLKMSGKTGWSVYDLVNASRFLKVSTEQLLDDSLMRIMGVSDDAEADMEKSGVIGQNVCPFWLVFLCGGGRSSCSSCMGGELEVGQNVCPEWPVRPCGTTVE